MARRHEAELKLRLGEKLRRRIERAAARNKQSMNTEILARLEGSFVDDDARSAGAIQAFRDTEAVQRIHHISGELLNALKQARGQIGEPVRRWEVIPLRHPIRETPDGPKAPVKSPEQITGEKSTEEKSEEREK
jgi:Arc-like DNA binding domain